jgi:hypothetical protein
VGHTALWSIAADSTRQMIWCGIQQPCSRSGKGPDPSLGKFHDGSELSVVTAELSRTDLLNILDDSLLSLATAEKAECRLFHCMRGFSRIFRPVCDERVLRGVNLPAADLPAAAEAFHHQ